MEDYSRRTFSTAQKNEFLFSAQKMSFCNEYENGVQQKIAFGEDGVEIFGECAFNMIASDEILIQSNVFEASGKSEILMIQTGERVTDSTLSNPRATLSMQGDCDCYARNDIIETTEEANRNSFFEDNPQEGDSVKLIANILTRAVIGIAAVAVTAVALVATCGIAGPVLVGACIGGIAAVTAVGVSDYINGNASSLGEYVISAISGTVSGAACAAWAPFGPVSSSIGKYIMQSVAAGAFSSALDNTITMAIKDAAGIENYSFEEYLESTFWAMISGGIAGGIFGGLSLSARKLFSTTIYKIQNGGVQYAKNYLNKLCKTMKWSNDDLFNALKSTYGDEAYNSFLINAFKNDPIRFFNQHTTGLLSISKGIMPGAIEATVGSGATDSVIDKIIEAILGEDENEYDEGFILNPN